MAEVTKMNKMKFILLAFCVCMALSQPPEDPLCVEANCPPNKPCRVVTDCQSTSYVCYIRARCFHKLPRWSQAGACRIGHPILVKRKGKWADTHCFTSQPCPVSTYCSSQIADSYTTCCRSDPANPVHPGVCPIKEDLNPQFCVDECNNDGDCSHGRKCCALGCKRACLVPE